MGASKIYIHSDFIDYYDTESSKVRENTIVYNRMMSDAPGRVEELRLINKLGNKVIKISPVRDMSRSITDVIVYTNIKGHRGDGKVIMSLSEANMIYPNKLGTEYFKDNNGITFKVLTVGKRRFRCIIKNTNGLVESEVISIDELENGYNHQIALPIYSIDYIKNKDGQMIISDFNMTQRLDYLGFESIMTSKEVVGEIYTSLVTYNKIQN